MSDIITKDYLLNLNYETAYISHIAYPEEEGGFSVSVPALPGCFTQGETIDEAIEMAKEAIALYVETLEEEGEPVPDDSRSLEYSLTFAS